MNEPIRVLPWQGITGHPLLQGQPKVYEPLMEEHMFRTFTFEEVNAQSLHRSDLKQVAATHLPAFALLPGTSWHCLRITIADQPETAEAVIIAQGGGFRIGIAWGSDAEWGDLYVVATDNFATLVADAIDDFINDSEAWDKRS